MFTKHFASMYSGSMYGAGADVFAVWGWVISHTKYSRVEVNPRKLAGELGMEVENVEAAVEWLSQPDDHSRWGEHGGRRMVKEGMFQYFIPSFAYYYSLRNEDERRESNKIAKRNQRAGENGKSELGTLKGKEVKSKKPKRGWIEQSRPHTLAASKVIDHGSELGVTGAEERIARAEDEDAKRLSGEAAALVDDDDDGPL